MNARELRQQVRDFAEEGLTAAEIEEMFRGLVPMIVVPQEYVEQIVRGAAAYTPAQDSEDA